MKVALLEKAGSPQHNTYALQAFVFSSLPYVESLCFERLGCIPKSGRVWRRAKLSIHKGSDQGSDFPSVRI